MDMIAVESSTAASIGYEASTATLYIRFRSGSLYAYQDVPAAEFEGMLEAESKGAYFNRRIRNAYRFRRVQ